MNNLKLFIYVYLLFLSGLFISIGYHGIDLSYNVLRISYFENADYYTTYSDISLGGHITTMENMYRTNWLFTFAGYLLLAMTFIYLLTEKKLHEM